MELLRKIDNWMIGRKFAVRSAITLEDAVKMLTAIESPGSVELTEDKTLFGWGSYVPNAVPSLVVDYVTREFSPKAGSGVLCTSTTYSGPGGTTQYLDFCRYPLIEKSYFGRSYGKPTFEHQSPSLRVEPLHSIVQFDVNNK